jgi:MFS family permease
MQQASEEDSIRYYGWAVAASLAITELTSWGILFYSFSVMVTPMRKELGWSAGTVTGAFAVAFLVSGISAIVVGRWVDRYGSRVVMTIGSCLGVVMLVLWSRVTNPIEFYLIWVGLGIASAMLFYEPAFAATATWFTNKRRLAVTIVTVGGALASVVFVPVATSLVIQRGWRTAVFALSVILAAVTIPLQFGVLRRRLQGPVQAVAAPRPLPLGQILRQQGFWRVSAAFALSAFTWVAMATYLIPFLISHHYGAALAAAIVSIMGASQIVGRILLLVVHRWLGDQWSIPSFFLLQTVGLVVLLLASASWEIGVFAFLFGVGFGGSYPARATVVADRFGTTAYGQINGIIAFLMTLTAALGLVAMGAVSAKSPAYSGAMVLVLLGSLISVAAIVSLDVFTPVRHSGVVSGVAADTELQKAH